MILDTKSWNKLCANWLINEIAPIWKNTNYPIPIDTTVYLLLKIYGKKISYKSAKLIFNELLKSQDYTIGRIDTIIDKNNLLSNSSKMDEVINNILQLEKNTKIINDIKNGKKQAIGSLIGQVLSVEKGLMPNEVKNRIEEILS